MKKIYKNILIVNTFGIGDVLFSTPLIKSLKDQVSASSIDIMCNRRCKHILRNNKNVNEIIIFEKDEFRTTWKKSKIAFIKKFIDFTKRLKAKKYNLVIDLSLGYQISLLLKLLGVNRRIGFNYRNRGRFLTDKLNLDGFGEKHVVSYYLDLLALLGVGVPKKAYPELYVSDDNDSWAGSFIAKNRLEGKFVIGVIPGGGKSWGDDARYRRWPVSNFAHVTDKLIDNFNISIILFGDKDEAVICDNMESFMHHKVLNTGGKTDLGQFRGLVNKGDLILCNEGGPLHIGVALKKPTVSIFGPVDEKNYGPYAEDMFNHIIVSNRDKCKPCYSRFKHKRCDTVTCLESISQDNVYNAVTSLIKRISNREQKPAEK